MTSIPLFKVFMAPEMVEPVSQVLMSGYIGQGPKVEEFESELKKVFQNDYLLTVNSCTSALQLAVHLIKPEDGFAPDDEIIVTPLTCFATVSAILANGVGIRWADVDTETCNIDLTDVERKLGPHTRALIVVHWGGYPVDLARLSSIQQKYKATYGRELPIIEDCAHCWDARYMGQLIGNSGNICCFSFQAIKFLTTGDGGLLVVPNGKMYRRAKNLRWFGLDRDAGASFRCIQDITESGFKYHMNDIAATIGLYNLPHIKGLVDRHRDNAAYFRDSLINCSGVTLLKEEPHVEPSYWLFTMKVEDRPGFTSHLESNSIAVSPVHARCDKHSCVQSHKSFLPGMDKLQTQHVSVPCGWWVSDGDREHIMNCIRKGW